MRFDAYIRVSQTRGRSGDSFQSPDQQTDRIKGWALAFNHEIAQVHVELDESGARADRPKLAEALARVESRQIDGIIVARLDRFGRSLLDGLNMISRIEKAGGTFVSVADGFDISTDTGRLVLRIMLSLAEFELDRFRGQWQDAKSRAVARGVHPSATPPFGYKRGDDRRLIPDPVAGPLVTEAFRRRAGGDGFTAVGRWLEEQGAVTQRGRSTFPLRAVRDIIRNEVYLGVAYAASTKDPALSMRNPDAHEALTDPDTWRKAQRPGRGFPARSLEPSPISPLMRCSGCRYVMRYSRRQVESGMRWIFTCKSPTCEHRTQITDDGAVQAWVEERFFAGRPDVGAAASTGVQGLELVRERARVAQAAFEQWRDDSTVQRSLGMHTYVAGLGARQDALTAAMADLARAEDEAEVVLIPDEVHEAWPELSGAEKRELLQSIIRAVFVMPAESSRGPVEPRLRIVWRGEDIALPTVGGRVAPPGPFVDDPDADAV